MGVINNVQIVDSIPSSYKYFIILTNGELYKIDNIYNKTLNIYNYIIIIDDIGYNNGKSISAYYKIDNFVYKFNINKNTIIKNDKINLNNTISNTFEQYLKISEKANNKITELEKHQIKPNDNIPYYKITRVQSELHEIDLNPDNLPGFDKSIYNFKTTNMFDDSGMYILTNNNTLVKLTTEFRIIWQYKYYGYCL